jgi:ATP-binding cassette subfamily C (CFTR/MRP) protein 4
MLPSAFFDVITVSYLFLFFSNLLHISILWFLIPQISLTAIGILFLVGLVNPWLLLPILFLSVIFVNLRQFYLKTARDVKRLEATSKSTTLNV